MNERIQQLAEQADIFINKSNCVESGNGTEIIGWHIEKFAELIVKECIANVKDWEKDSRNHISYMLERHFGVDK